MLLQQVKTRTTAGTGKVSPIQPHQDDHLVGNGTHRLQCTDRERTAAMPEASAVHRQSLGQHLEGHGRIQLQFTGLSPLAPVVQGLGPALQLGAPGAAITEQILQLSQQ